MNSFRDVLQRSEVVRAAFEAAKESGRKAYLVGGAVRDLLMSLAPGNDFDFVVEGEGMPFARIFAGKVGGSFFVLDEERDASRVVLKKGFQADFSGIRGNIEEDLGLRDFTINSMAIPLDSVFAGNAHLLDPLGGVSDIKDMVLRASSRDSLKEDPLRVLRAFRFCSIFSLRMDSELLGHIKEEGEALELVSPERVRSELFMILEMPGAYKVFKDMDEAGVLKVLFPEIHGWKGFFQGGWHAYDLFDHSMKTVAAAEDVLSHLKRHFPRCSGRVESHMSEEVEAGVTRRGLLKLASLLHDSGKFYTRTVEEGGRGRFFGHERAGEGVIASIAKRLKLGRRSEAILRGLSASHMRVFGLSRLSMVTGRARYRFFRDAAGNGTDLLLLSLADALATPMERKGFEELSGLVGELADYYFEEFMTVPPEPMLTGKDIMTVFGIPEGKEIGEMLDALREAEAAGEVSDRREAIERLRKWKLRFRPG